MTKQPTPLREPNAAVDLPAKVVNPEPNSPPLPPVVEKSRRTTISFQRFPRPGRRLLCSIQLVPIRSPIGTFVL